MHAEHANQTISSQTISRVGIAVGAAVAGATAMYLLDDRSGRRRRAVIRDQFDRRIHDGQSFLRKAKVDARQRAQGLYRETRSLLQRTPADDGTIEQRVRAQLGRLTSHPGAIHVSCSEHIVELKGDVLANEVERVLRGVKHVRGVKGVHNELHSHADAQGVPALQGNGSTGRTATAQFEYLQDNWSPAPRMLAGAVGLALLGGSLGRQPTAATGLALAGGLALLRSISNRPLSEFIGGGAQDEPNDILVQKTLRVNAKPDDAYRLWRDLENLPSFMSHVREVTRVDERLYRWRVDGPANVPVEWNAEITADVPGELIAWRSAPDSAVRSSGVVQFEPLAQGTRIHIRMSYRPPASAIGHTIAKLFGRDPKRQMDDDLLRFKTLLETGSVRRSQEAASAVHH